MNAFVQFNNQLINLENVSNINFLAKSKRIVMNMNYSINTGKPDKLISDYIYLDFDAVSEYEEAKTYILGVGYICDNFIHKGLKDGLINIKSISSVKFDEDRLRVIFNLSHSSSIKNKQNKPIVTSDFVFVDFDDLYDYNTYVDFVIDVVL